MPPTPRLLRLPLLSLAAALFAGPAAAHIEPCVGGFAGAFECHAVDLLEHMNVAAFDATSTNDIWGWTDPQTGKEYAVLGLNNGTAFIDLSDPEEPVYLGKLPTHSVNSVWRSVKVYGNYALVATEAANHGVQIFDLTQLRNVANPPAVFQTTAHYGGLSTSHTLEIDSESGFLYSAGSNTCNGGLHIVDVRQPLQPKFAGCFSDDDYTHEAQCTVYRGPDPDHQGAQICMACNIDTLTIVDVTSKSQPTQISRTGYPGVAFAHQGWLTEDHRFFLLDDERDEPVSGHNTKTYIFDVQNLDAPVLIGTHIADTTAVDHNQYIRGNYVYQSNYEAGLHILKLDDVAAGALTEVAFFDTEPGQGAGSWTNYPFFESGIVIVSDIDRGFFVLQPRLCSVPPAPGGMSASAGGPNQIALTWLSDPPAGGSFELYRKFGACGAPPVALETFSPVAAGLTGSGHGDAVSGSVQYSYVLVARDESGLCRSAPSGCVSATTGGACNAPPAFAGVASASDQGTSRCGIGLSWPAAASRCGGPTVTYAVYRGEDANFVPSPANRLASGLGGTSFVDHTIQHGLNYAYVVRATDPLTGAEDVNHKVAWGRASGPIGPGFFTAGAEPHDPVLESAGQAEHLGWEVSGDSAHSGKLSYYSSYVPGSCLAIETPPIRLEKGAPAITFWTHWNIANADGGQLQISTDGQSWSRLNLNGGYPGTMASSSDACGFPTGEPVFVGQQNAWNQRTASLAAWADQEVQLRFIFSTDPTVNGPGWWIDDIAIGPATVPGTCLSDTLFWDGFESGDLSAWWDVVP
jgi:choice-of-anchor B domain-containing protein